MERGKEEGWWQEGVKYTLDNYWFQDASASDSDEAPIASPWLDREADPLPISTPQAHFTKLPYRLLIQFISFLTIKEVLALTAVCAYLNRLKFNYNYLKSLEMRPSGPLQSPNFAFRRRELIDCMRRKVLSSAAPNLVLQHTIEASSRANSLLKVELVDTNLIYFSESNGRLLVWEIKKGVQATLYSFECIKNVYELCVEKGKIALMGNFGLEVKYFPWETRVSADITSHHYSWSTANNDGTVYFYSPYRLVVAIASYHVMIFSETLQLLQRLRDTAWPFNFIQSCKVHATLPYLAIAGNMRIMLYDVSLVDRKRPVYEYEMPILCDFKFHSILIEDTFKPKCYIIVHNSHRSKDAVILVNGKLLYKANGDSAVLDNHLFVFAQSEMRVIQFDFSSSGPKQVHSFRIYERLLDPILVCTYERCMIIAHKEHTKNSYAVRLYDYNGWPFCKLSLTDLYPKTAISTMDSIAIYGNYPETAIKILIQFNYFTSTPGPLALRQFITFEQQKVAQIERNLSKEAAAREEFFQKRREAHREEMKVQQEHEDFKQSKYWKPSRRSVPAITTDEDFSLC
jgi:hypothetical protein